MVAPGVDAIPARPLIRVQTTVAEVVERVIGEQEDRLGGPGRALQRRTEPDVTDLDAPMGGLDPQVGDDTAGAARGAVDHREKQRVAGARDSREPGPQLARARVRPVGHAAAVGWPAPPPRRTLVSFALRRRRLLRFACHRATVLRLRLGRASGLGGAALRGLLGPRLVELGAPPALLGLL